jgi:hypothetical protein
MPDSIRHPAITQILAFLALALTLTLNLALTLTLALNLALALALALNLNLNLFFPRHRFGITIKSMSKIKKTKAGLLFRRSGV